MRFGFQKSASISASDETLPELSTSVHLDVHYNTHNDALDPAHDPSSDWASDEAVRNKVPEIPNGPEDETAEVRSPNQTRNPHSGNPHTSPHSTADFTIFSAWLLKHVPRLTRAPWAGAKKLSKGVRKGVRNDQGPCPYAQSGMHHDQAAIRGYPLQPQHFITGICQARDRFGFHRRSTMSDSTGHSNAEHDDVTFEGGVLQPYLKFLAASAQDDDNVEDASPRATPDAEDHEDYMESINAARKASTALSTSESLSDSVRTALSSEPSQGGDGRSAANRDREEANDRRVLSLLGISDTENESMIGHYSSWLYTDVLLQGRIYITETRLLFYAGLPPPSTREINAASLRIKLPGITGLQTYQRFWFILRQDTLSWHNSPAETYFPQGIVNLADIVEVEMRPPPPGQKESSAIMLHRKNSQSPIKLKADNPNSAHEWIKYLQKAVFRAHVADDYVMVRIPLANVVSASSGMVASMARTLKITCVSKAHSHELQDFVFIFFSEGLPIISSIRDRVDSSVEAYLETTGQTLHHAVFTKDGNLDVDRTHIGDVTYDVDSTLPSTLLRLPNMATVEREEPWAPRGSGTVLPEEPAQTSDHTESSPEPSRRETIRDFTSLLRSSRGQSTAASRSESRSTSRAPSPPLSPSSTPGGSASTSTSLLSSVTSKIKGLTEDAPRLTRPNSIPGSSLHLPFLRNNSDDEEEDGESDDGQPSKFRAHKMPDAAHGDDDLDETALSDPEDDTESTLAPTAPDKRWSDAKAHHDDFTKRFRDHFSLGPRSYLLTAYLCTLRHMPPTGSGGRTLKGKLYVGNDVLGFRHVSRVTGQETRVVVPLADITRLRTVDGPDGGNKRAAIELVGTQAAAGTLCIVLTDSKVCSDVITVLKHALDNAHETESDSMGGVHVQHAEEKAEAGFLESSMRSARLSTYEPAMVQKLQARIPPVVFDPYSSEFQEHFLKVPMKELNITMLTIGSRGDVQPYIALALGLQREGHKCRIATHAEFKDWVESFGIGFTSVAGDPSALMNIMIEHGSFSVSFLKDAASKFRAWVDELLSSAWTAVKDDTDMLIESPQAMAGIHIAEKLQIPYFRAFTMPWTRTRTYPHAFIVPTQRMGASYNYLTYVMFDNLFWRGTESQVNRWRKKTLELPATSLEGMHQQEVPFLYSVSPTVMVPPVDQPDWVHYTGYWELPEHAKGKDQTLDPKIQEYIDESRKNNRKIVYIGFGSILVSDATQMTQTIVEAVKEADVSCILARGWSQRKSGADAATEEEKEAAKEAEEKQKKLLKENGIFEIEAAPHNLLFPQLDAIVHHGGSGSTGMSLRCGKPTIIKPFFGDQFFYARRVEDIGAGIHLPKLEKQALASALQRATTNKRMITRARLVGDQISREHGVDTAIRCIYREMQYAKIATERRTRSKPSLALDIPGLESLPNLKDTLPTSFNPVNLLPSGKSYRRHLRHVPGPSSLTNVSSWLPFSKSSGSSSQEQSRSGSKAGTPEPEAWVAKNTDQEYSWKPAS